MYVFSDDLAEIYTIKCPTSEENNIPRHNGGKLNVRMRKIARLTRDLVG